MREHILDSWYKEKRTNTERSEIYHTLKLNGYNRRMALRGRDFSDGHIKQLLVNKNGN